MPIEQVKPGQRVWAYDLETNQWVLCDVEATFDNGVTDDLLDIVLKTEDGVTETLRQHRPTRSGSAPARTCPRGSKWTNYCPTSGSTTQAAGCSPST